MSYKLLDRAKMSVSGAPGTGAVTVGTALNGYQTFVQAGLVDGDTFPYLIEDGSAWEFGVGAWSASANAVTRAPTKSSLTPSTTALTVSAQATISACVRAEDLTLSGAGTLANLTDITIGTGETVAGQVPVSNGSGGFVVRPLTTADVPGSGGSGGSGGIAGISVYQGGSRVGSANQFQAINFIGANAAIVANGSNGAQADVTMNVGGSSGGGGVTAPTLVQSACVARTVHTLMPLIRTPTVGNLIVMLASASRDTPTAVPAGWEQLIFDDADDSYDFIIVRWKPVRTGDTYPQYPFGYTSAGVVCATVMEIAGCGGIGEINFKHKLDASALGLCPVAAPKNSLVVGQFSATGAIAGGAPTIANVTAGTVAGTVQIWANSSMTGDLGGSYPSPEPAVDVPRNVAPFYQAVGASGPVDISCNFGLPSDPVNNLMNAISLVLLGG